MRVCKDAKTEIHVSKVPQVQLLGLKTKWRAELSASLLLAEKRIEERVTEALYTQCRRIHRPNFFFEITRGKHHFDFESSRATWGWCPPSVPPMNINQMEYSDSSLILRAVCIKL